MNPININPDNNSPVIILIDVELEKDNIKTNQNNTEAGEFIDQIINIDKNKFTYTDINRAIIAIKQLKFHETIIIVNAENFIDFVKLFNENLINICIIPKIIIFSEKKIAITLPNNIQNKLFYTHFGVKNKIQIYNFLKKEGEENKKIIADEYPQPQPDTESALIFQRIRSRGDLHLPSFYKILLDISETNDDRFIKTMKEYKDDKIYKKLFNPIISIPDIPIELLSKYYARMYTIEGQFFKKMKVDLLIDYNKDNIIYQSYIKTLYEGLERKALKPLKSFQGIQLYSAQYFTENQIKELNEYRLRTVDYYKVPIIFSKLFLSFTKDITIAERFISSYKKNTMLTVVEANDEYDLNTHTDIEELSSFHDEREVLFFPFSAFGITDFEFDTAKKRHIMKLIYLGRFIKNTEDNTKFDIKKDELPEQYFKTLFEKSGLIDQKKIKEMKVRDHKIIIKREDRNNIEKGNIFQSNTQLKDDKEQNKNSKWSTKKKILVISAIVVPIIIAAVIVAILLTRKKSGGSSGGSSPGSGSVPDSTSPIIECGEGTYLDTSSSTCRACGVGYYSLRGATSCTRCENGYTSAGNSANCEICEAGTFSNDSFLSCTICEPGYYSYQGASRCNLCYAGTYSSSDRTECLECSEGYYSEEGASNCIACKS